MEDNKIRIGITQGDINGVGYEVILKTCWSYALRLFTVRPRWLPIIANHWTCRRISVL